MNFIKTWFLKNSSVANQEIDFHKSKLDRARFGDIRDRYKNESPDPGFSKYTELDRFLKIALSHYDLVGLTNKTGLSVLDIGTGPGYFPFICSNFGHAARAMDVPNHSFYNEMTDLLGVNRFEHSIQAFEPLPQLSQRFDLITAFAICFNCHASDALWGVEEWGFFLSDIRKYMAEPKAILFLKFNREPNGSFFSDELREYFNSEGANINYDSVRIEY